LFSRIIVGTRLSLSIAVGAAILAAVIGTAIGITSALAGGLVDTAIMRIVDAFLSFPGVLLALTLMALLGPGSLNVMGAMVIAFTPRFVRLVRGSARAVTGLDFVIAAKAMGASPFRIAIRHILPSVLGSILVMFTFTVAVGIILEASLSFLGLGAHGRIPTWGAIASEGQAYLRVFPWTSTLSGLAITLAVLGFNTLGDNLRDIFDPKLRDD
jgi:ABC-type dipeptide/oligopeptide/nickel transport system permease subunit